MTLFLRTQKNKTIVDIEVSKNDVRCAIDIENYSKFLLENLDKKEQIINDFSIRSHEISVER